MASDPTPWHSHGRAQRCDTRCPAHVAVLDTHVPPVNGGVERNAHLPATPEVWLNHGGFKSYVEPHFVIEVKMPDGSTVRITHEQILQSAQAARRILAPPIGRVTRSDKEKA